MGRDSEKRFKEAGRPIKPGGYEVMEYVLTPRYKGLQVRCPAKEDPPPPPPVIRAIVLEDSPHLLHGLL